MTIENLGTQTVDTRNQKIPLIVDLGFTRQLYRFDIVKEAVTNPELIVGINVENYSKIALWDILLEPGNPLKIELLAYVLP